MRNRTPAYWPTRLMLVAAFLVPVAAALICFTAPQPVGQPMSDSIDVAGPVSIALAAALWLVGVTWMLRIHRAPRDEPPDWRYRDR
jgi:hypothetical protein